MTEEATPAATAPSWSLARPSARRSLILCAIGALVGLAIAGLGLFTAKGTRTSAVPAEDVALVNQVPILMSDYLAQLRALYDVPLSQATPAQKRKTLDDMIREELAVQRGVELGMQSDTIEVRQALVGAVEAQTAADAVMAQPTETELRRYYDRNHAAFESEGVMRLADHLLHPGATPREIDAAIAGLRAARADPLAADRVAPRSTRMGDGDEFYFAARLHLGDRLFAVARALKPGDVSPPVSLPDGVHLLVMQQNVVPVVAPFAAARDKVLASYIDAQSKTLTAANDRFLRKRADVQVAEGYQ
ncbi:peptidyl-prolyl cis-trans isomerase [Sphingomonas bacterium]|uniref:peptidyl-prolyl cis-trans isomerase n=1 Tax=Sphingomonas bacterium TaxID=1895847 RepID=UPI0020C6F0D2|nr:peptidyl-prolyl cis-trans isomerase [Sphingomonas bacterium]